MPGGTHGPAINIYHRSKRHHTDLPPRAGPASPATASCPRRPTCRWCAAVAARRGGSGRGGAITALLLLHAAAGRALDQVRVLEDALQEVVRDLRRGQGTAAGRAPGWVGGGRAQAQVERSNTA